jgi:RHS repeat-associated protein
VRGINYDKNGNIKTLSRLARRSSDTDIVVFDSLSYTYDGNRLKNVSDAISGQNDLKDFPGGGSQGTETFFYDSNGNMNSDNVRGIQLTYNHMNMPTTILSSEGHIENTYSWDGSKRRRRVLDQYQQLQSDERYFGDLVTENGLPSLILHPDGYVDVSGIQPLFTYHLKDHLGNVRIVMQAGGSSGNLKQTNDYYPFGMAFIKNAADSEEESFARENKYKYNGKEEQPMPGKWLDYGFRMYDPELGRWHVIDGHAESYFSWSPYNYVVNNPINLIDLLGLDPVYRNGKYYETDKNGEEYEVDWNYVNNWIQKNDGIAAKYTFSSTNGKTEIVSTEKGNAGLSFIVNGKGYTANSYMTLMGRDDKNNSVGDFSGIETLGIDEILRVLGHGSWAIFDKYYGGVEKAMLGESVGGLLDYKNIAYDIFGLNRKSLIEINGVVYNANEAGNFLWGMVLEYHGGILSPNAIAQIGTKRGQNRDDERWEQKAITSGRAYALELLQRPDLKQRILENRLDFRK